MNRYEFLKGLHRVYRPRTYLEIGVNDGRSLALSRTRTIAVDPAFKVTAALHCDLELVKATSDDFFARPRPMRSLRRGVVDLAFIDGLHLFEYALRDLFHTERHTRWTSVMVLDDMLPRSVDEAARDRHTDAWTGDVYKVAAALAEYRPDLLCVAVDTAPTGQLLVFGADSGNRVLSRSYDEIYAKYVVPDPQQVPQDILSPAPRRRPRGVPGRGLLARAHPRPRPGPAPGWRFRAAAPADRGGRERPAPGSPYPAEPGPVDRDASTRGRAPGAVVQAWPRVRRCARALTGRRSRGGSRRTPARAHGRSVWRARPARRATSSPAGDGVPSIGSGVATSTGCRPRGRRRQASRAVHGAPSRSVSRTASRHGTARTAPDSMLQSRVAAPGGAGTSRPGRVSVTGSRPDEVNRTEAGTGSPSCSGRCSEACSSPPRVCTDERSGSGLSAAAVLRVDWSTSRARLPGSVQYGVTTSGGVPTSAGRTAAETPGAR